MIRLIHRTRALVLLVTLATWACGDSTDTTTTPTQPTPTTFTDTFTGNLTQNGAATFPFTAQASGTVIATLTSVAGEGVTIGLSLGNWDGSACTAVIANDSAAQGAILTGAISAAGNFCVRVYDVGRLTAQVAFTVDVVHP